MKAKILVSAIYIAIQFGGMLCGTSWAYEPGDSIWSRTFGGPGSDDIRMIRQTPDGGYIAAGRYSYSNSQAALMDSLGVFRWWNRAIGGNGYDWIEDFSLTDDGGFATFGSTSSYGTTLDFWLIKWDKLGQEQWSEHYDVFNQPNYLQAGQLTNDGGYIMVGYVPNPSPGQNDIWVVKTDSLGEMLWNKIHGGTDDDGGYDIKQTNEGGYIIVGATESYGNGGTDVYLLKTDSVGDTLWTRTYGNQGVERAYSVQQTTDGGYIMVGYTDLAGPGNKDFYVIKTNASGSPLWVRTYGGWCNDVALDVAQTPDGGYIIAGYYSPSIQHFDIYLVRIDHNGHMLWEKTFGGVDDDAAISITLTAEGNYIIGGYVAYGETPTSIVMKVAGDGPEVSINLMPDSDSIVVNPGDYFTYTGEIVNNTDRAQRVDVWLTVKVPHWGSILSLDQISNVDLEPYQTLTFSDIRQDIPRNAISGTYAYSAYCGHLGSAPMNGASLNFSVPILPVPDIPREDDTGDGWNVSGWFQTQSEESPPISLELGNTPNPFNSQTFIGFNIPISGRATLDVYNLLGQKVENLLDAELNSGEHQVMWDGSDFSSGLYLYKLHSGSITAIGRMSLVK